VTVWQLRVVQCSSDKPGIFRCEQTAQKVQSASVLREKLTIIFYVARRI